MHTYVHIICCSAEVSLHGDIPEEHLYKQTISSYSIITRVCGQMTHRIAHYDVAFFFFFLLFP